MYNSILERGKREGRRINSLTVAFTLGYMAALGRETNAENPPKPKACVTGGSGFVAGHVCKVLIESGRFSEVRATTRTKSAEKTGFLEKMGVKVVADCGKTSLYRRTRYTQHNTQHITQICSNLVVSIRRYMIVISWHIVHHPFNSKIRRILKRVSWIPQSTERSTCCPRR